MQFEQITIDALLHLMILYRHGHIVYLFDFD